MTETRYSNARIYKITDFNYTKCYIGSTCEALSKRLGRHYSDYICCVNKYHCMTKALFDEFGFENCKIELLEQFPCNSKEELLAREGHHIRNNDCVNKQIPGRTMKEWRLDNKDTIREYNKQYVANHREWDRENSKKYRDEHPDYLKTYSKAYREKNKDELREKKKAYYEHNKEQAKQRSSASYENRKEFLTEKVQCMCGYMISRRQQTQHMRTTRHKKQLELKESND